MFRIVNTFEDDVIREDAGRCSGNRWMGALDVQGIAGWEHLSVQQFAAGFFGSLSLFVTGSS
jgi:hypothetical protein